MSFLEHFKINKKRYSGFTIVAVVILIAALLYLGSGSSHPTIGNWEVEKGRFEPGHSLIVYDDGLASFDGYRCTWEELDFWSIRLQCSIKGSEMIGEFDRTGTLLLGTTELSFDRFGS